MDEGASRNIITLLVVLLNRTQKAYKKLSLDRETINESIFHLNEE